MTKTGHSRKKLELGTFPVSPVKTCFPPALGELLEDGVEIHDHSKREDKQREAEGVAQRNYERRTRGACVPPLSLV